MQDLLFVIMDTVPMTWLKDCYMQGFSFPTRPPRYLACVWQG